MAVSGEEEDYGVLADSDSDDDFQEDPDFDILEKETRSSFRSLSIKKKPPKKSNIAMEMNEETEGEPDIIIGELNEKDRKSYGIIHKLIDAGEVEKLKVNQSKVYLRKHGLRLTGKKDTLIHRIKEHLEVLNGGGEKKYPAFSFVVNCKGDACTGDVVLFEQNVYEMFNIASRAANGPPCGTRLVAGRIVKESYGAKKHQHTFTIEVLWSKGEKPLPTLHQLLIKGRNLYRLKTMRQKWEDEGERQKILTEKHARGFVARSKREARVQEREMWKMIKTTRALVTTTGISRKQEKSSKIISDSLSFTSKPMVNQPAKNFQDTSQAQNYIQKECQDLRSCKENSCGRPEPLQMRPEISLNANKQLESSHLPRQPLTIMNCNSSSGAAPPGMHSHQHHAKFKPSTSSFHESFDNEGPANKSTIQNLLRGHGGEIRNTNAFSAYQENRNLNAANTSFQRHGESSEQRPFNQGNPNFNRWRSAKQMHAGIWTNNSNATGKFVSGPIHKKSQLCSYYPQGRCYYGSNCKFLHQGGGNKKM